MDSEYLLLHVIDEKDKLLREVCTYKIALTVGAVLIVLLLTAVSRLLLASCGC